MADFDLKNADPRAIARAAEYVNGHSFDAPGGTPRRG